MRKDALKRRIVAEINTLPEDELPRMLDLVGKLKLKQKMRRSLSAPEKRPAPAKNPLRELIGLAAVEPFAHRIDEELYGKQA